MKPPRHWEIGTVLNSSATARRRNKSARLHRGPKRGPARRYLVGCLRDGNPAQAGHAVVSCGACLLDKRVVAVVGCCIKDAFDKVAAVLPGNLRAVLLIDHSRRLS